VSFIEDLKSAEETGNVAMTYAELSRARTATDARPQISLELDSRELALTYDLVSGRQFEHGKVLVAALRLKAGERVLDVGCGTGRLGAYVAELVAPHGQVCALDPLPLRVELAQGRHPGLQASVGRGEDLSMFAGDSFDAAYLNSVLHWIDDKALALSEVARVLKPGGRLAVNSADADRPHQSGQLIREALRELGMHAAARVSALGTRYRVNAQALARLLKDAGFVNVQIQAQTFVDAIRDVDDVFAWSRSSSFGNFLAGLSDGERSQVRERLAKKLERLRNHGQVELERYLVFASAQKRAVPGQGK
jgi:ubiquinone/menaquinone biosynthesis C-methylase UbiE